MRNILLVDWAVLILTIIGPLWIINEFIKKRENYILNIIAISVVWVIAIMASFPSFKDLVEQKTTVVVGVYEKYERGTKESNKLYIDNGDETIKLIVPRVNRDVTILEEGRTYRFEYFNNTRIVKEYELIE